MKLFGLLGALFLSPIAFERRGAFQNAPCRFENNLLIDQNGTPVHRRSTWAALLVAVLQEGGSGWIQRGVREFAGRKEQWLPGLSGVPGNSWGFDRPDPGAWEGCSTEWQEHRRAQALRGQVQDQARPERLTGSAPAFSGIVTEGNPFGQAKFVDAHPFKSKHPIEGAHGIMTPFLRACANGDAIVLENTH